MYKPADSRAQVLLSTGYKYVDVRPAFEWDDFGHAAQAVNVPVMHMERKWSSEEQKKVRAPGRAWFCLKPPLFVTKTLLRALGCRHAYGPGMDGRGADEGVCAGVKP